MGAGPASVTRATRTTAPASTRTRTTAENLAVAQAWPQMWAAGQCSRCPAPDGAQRTNLLCSNILSGELVRHAEDGADKTKGLFVGPVFFALIMAPLLCFYTSVLDTESRQTTIAWCCFV